MSTELEPGILPEVVVLGNEAAALAAIHAGVTAAYAYPGTPSTELLEYLRRYRGEHRPRAEWAVNEKTAYEQALGVSMAGRRALVAMKHVGLNVAMDPFVNSALVSIHGGFVVVVADDPGMHSSQNEQDTRVLAEFAKVPVLEPATQQEVYDMTREAFERSERFQVPVLLRLVTRLAHSRAAVTVGAPDVERPLSKPDDTTEWTLLPVFARRQWRRLLRGEEAIRDDAEGSHFNRFEEGDASLGVITAGVGRNYLLENLDDLEIRPTRLHVGTYPLPEAAIRDLVARVDRVLVLEDGSPFIEKKLLGLIPHAVPIQGRLSGHLPLDGELDPDRVRAALGLEPRPGMDLSTFTAVPRPPRLCQGCPHRDTYAALHLALEGYETSLVASDIGCYSLGALPPYGAIESCVCMGASIGMAKGAADAGLHPSVAVIGDSTFFHSGMTAILDAVQADTRMTVLILDNSVIAMTGAQETSHPPTRLEGVLAGLGVPPEHLHVVEAHPRNVEAIAGILRREIEYDGLSVCVLRRECVESLRRKKQQAARKAGS